MKTCKYFWLVFIFVFTGLLSACTSNPIGDFGRIDASKAEHITKAYKTRVYLSSNKIISSPLNFSKTEKKFRLSAHLLRQTYILSSDAIPMGQLSAINHFIHIDLNKIKDRHQAIIADIGKLHFALHVFQRQANKVLAQDNRRNYSNSEIINKEYIKAIHDRHLENQRLISSVVSHLRGLYHAYIYVVDHGNIVEPTLKDTEVRDKLSRFYTHVLELEYSNY